MLAPVRGKSHMASARRICAGLVQIRFWSRATFLKIFRSSVQGPRNDLRMSSSGSWAEDLFSSIGREGQPATLISHAAALGVGDSWHCALFAPTQRIRENANATKPGPVSTAFIDTPISEPLKLPRRLKK